VERRVQQAASDLQYRPNSVSVSLRKGITQTIGFVSDTVAATERLSGIGEALAAAGTRYAGAYGCLEWEPGNDYRATRAVLATARPRALICFDDRLALGAHQALWTAASACGGRAGQLVRRPRRILDQAAAYDARAAALRPRPTCHRRSVRRA
jgi:DNA-binding LacI/PurR family transcriptional regulator